MKNIEILTFKAISTLALSSKFSFMIKWVSFSAKLNELGEFLKFGEHSTTCRNTDGKRSGIRCLYDGL